MCKFPTIVRKKLNVRKKSPKNVRKQVKNIFKSENNNKCKKKVRKKVPQMPKKCLGCQN